MLTPWWHQQSRGDPARMTMVSKLIMVDENLMEES